jgi:hypothetical protein
MDSASRAHAYAAGALANSTPCFLAGVSLRETGGSAGATVNIYDGTDNTGALLTTVALVASGSADLTFNFPRWANTGIFVEKTGSGVIAGSLHIL